jgi:hypothetical protein
MPSGPKKTGIMLSADPGTSAFSLGLDRADQAVASGDQLYLYCIDDAVEGLTDPKFEKLQQAGAHLYACAYSLQRRGLVPPGIATLSGLTVLSDIMASTDEFHSFN